VVNKMAVICLFCGKTLNTSAKTCEAFQTSFGSAKVHKACVPSPRPVIDNITFFRHFFGRNYSLISDMFIDLKRAGVPKRVALRQVKDDFGVEYSESMITLFERALSSLPENSGYVAPLRSGKELVTCPKCGAKVWVRSGWSIFTCYGCGNIVRKPEYSSYSKIDNPLKKTRLMSSPDAVTIDLWKIPEPKREELLDNVTADAILKNIPVYGDVALMRRCLSIVKGTGVPKSVFIYPSKGRYIIEPSPNSVFFFVNPIPVSNGAWEDLEEVWVKHRTEYVDYMLKRSYPHAAMVTYKTEVKQIHAEASWKDLPIDIQDDFVIWAGYKGYRVKSNPDYSCDKCGTLLPIESVMAGITSCVKCHTKSDSKGLMICCERCGTNYMAYSRGSNCPNCNKIVSVKNLRLLYDSLKLRKTNPEDIEVPASPEMCARCGTSIALPGYRLCWHCKKHQKGLIEKKAEIMRKNTYSLKATWVGMSNKERFDALRTVCQPSEARNLVLKPWDSLPSAVRLNLAKCLSGEKLFWHFQRNPKEIKGLKLSFYTDDDGHLRATFVHKNGKWFTEAVEDKEEGKSLHKKYSKNFDKYWKERVGQHIGDEGMANYADELMDNPMDVDKRPPKELFIKYFRKFYADAKARWNKIPEEVKAIYTTPRELVHALIARIWYRGMKPQTRRRYEAMRAEREKHEARTGISIPYPHENPTLEKALRENHELKKIEESIRSVFDRFKDPAQLRKMSDVELMLGYNFYMKSEIPPALDKEVKRRELSKKHLIFKIRNYSEALMNPTPEEIALESGAAAAGAALGTALIPVPGVGTAVGSAVGMGVAKAAEEVGKMMGPPKEGEKKPEAPKTNPHGRAITLKQAKALKYGDHIYHRVLKNRDGSPMKFKVNGKPRTWKTRPDEVVVPLKRGMFSYLSIHEGELKDFTLGPKSNPIPGPAREGAELYLKKEKKFNRIVSLLKFSVKHEVGERSNEAMLKWNSAMDLLDKLSKSEQKEFKKNNEKLWKRCFGR
jgi:ribosomal protein L37AE/L43A